MNLVARTLAPAALVAVGVMNAAPIHADDSSFFAAKCLRREQRNSCRDPLPAEGWARQQLPEYCLAERKIDDCAGAVIERRQPGRIVGNPEGARARGKRDTPRILLDLGPSRWLCPEGRRQAE
jgi:hypothetical protein